MHDCGAAIPAFSHARKFDRQPAAFDQSGSGDAEHDISYYLKHRLWFDTCSFHHPALRCAIDTVSADRLLLATDFPFRGPMSRAVGDIDSAGLPTEQRDAILRGTPTRLFGSHL